MDKKKKYNKIEMEIITLTQKLAQTYLDNLSPGQRKLSHRYVLRYIDAMKRNMWQLGGTFIIRDWFGYLIQGQHICAAVVSNSTPIKIIEIRGVNPSVFKVLDKGRPRKLFDALEIEGETYCKPLSSALGWLFCYITNRTYQSGSKWLFQIEDGLELLEKNPGLRKSLEKVLPACQGEDKIISLSIGTFLHYVFAKKSKSQADEFFQKLATGEGFKKNDPIRLLRDRLLKDKGQIIKMSREYKINIAIKAWNVFRRNGTLTRLIWRGYQKEGRTKIK